MCCEIDKPTSSTDCNLRGAGRRLIAPLLNMLSTRHGFYALLICAISIDVAVCDDKVTVVTFGSVVKLEHFSTGHRLHSHEVKYGSGSGQQSVTCYPDAGDVNSYWIVKHAFRAPRAKPGSSVPCGGIIRLQHLATGRNLHSHLHEAPLSHDLEVSAYKDEDENGDESKGRWHDGDTGDNWVLQCDVEDGKPWPRFGRIVLKHVDTSAYLSSSKRFQFGDPIAGQLQVSAMSRKNRDCYWRSNEGIFLKPVE